MAPPSSKAAAGAAAAEAGASPASASRLPPPVVPPVVIGGMRFQPRVGTPAEDGQVGGWLDAYDTARGQRLWTLKVYDNVRRPELEGDVQDVFFQSMQADADGRHLRIVDESGRAWRVDVMARTVSADGGDPKSGRGGLLTID